MLRLVVSIIIAAAFWFVMFSPWTSSHVNFWHVMLLATASLTGLSIVFGKDWKKQFSFNLKDIAIGIGSAILLYGIFYVGNEISGLIFDFSREQVNQVYVMKDGHNKIYISLALLLWIGPAEEIFWRGYIQRTLENQSNRKLKAFFITTLIYAFVHIWAFNFMLFMAALVCGAFWGLIYSRNKNLLTVLVSHAIWDIAVFILFPIS